VAVKVARSIVDCVVARRAAFRAMLVIH
jgi:hypothetical protein